LIIGLTIHVIQLPKNAYHYNGIVHIYHIYIVPCSKDVAYFM